jgi:hypothetical protein
LGLKSKSVRTIDADSGGAQPERAVPPCAASVLYPTAKACAV